MYSLVILKVKITVDIIKITCYNHIYCIEHVFLYHI